MENNDTMKENKLSDTNYFYSGFNKSDITDE